MRAIVLLALGLVACSSESPPGSPLDTGVVDAASEGGDDGAVDANDGRPAACTTLDAELQAALDSARGKNPNATLAVQDEACGLRAFVSGDAANATLTTLWRMGSVTKTFVSAVILGLVKEGKVALTDPLSKWVDAVPKTDGVTVRMLLNHTSGIFNYTEDPEFFADRTKKWTPREIVDLATKTDPYFAPGADFHYSNTNYALLGMIAEKAGGKKISALIRERAIGPAGLSATFFDGEETVVGTMTKGFTGTKDVTFVSDMSGPWAAGAMVGPAIDLARWASTLYGTTKILDADQRKALLADPASGGNYGLGVVILKPAVTVGGGQALGHDGAIDGFATQMFWFEGKKTAVASIVNKTGGDANAITLAAVKILFR
ncbi:MAG: beta-lactamase family protein [Myxococcales bacterium]|nr:beta-lactamase family protein [Myxococcales bacterium]